MIANTMSIRRFMAAALGMLALSAAGPVTAQTDTPDKTQLRMSFKVDVALLRLLGGKEVSRLPFTLWVQATPPTVGKTPSSGTQRLRLGVDVPIGTISETNGTSMKTTTTGENYRNIGTSIDATVTLLDDGRYDVRINLQDSSIFSGEGDGKTSLRSADSTAFRTFSTDNHWPMRDGQTLPFALATDKVTGETVRVDVTLAVVK